MLAAWYKQIDSAGKCIPSLAPSKACNLHMYGNDGVRLSRQMYSQ